MRCLFVICLVISCCLHAQVKREPLTGNWQFRERGTHRYYPAQVPGTIHTDLLKQGLIPDPFYATNEAGAQWIEHKSWEYFLEFDAGKNILLHKHVELTFEGLDTYASVFLNDSLVLLADNMFRSWTLEVRNFLKPGKNRLRVVFAPAADTGKALATKLPYTLPGDEKVFTRKAQYQYGWDWGPRLVTCGMYKPVYFTCWDDFRLKSLNHFIRELHDSIAVVGIIAETEGLPVKDLQLDLQIRLADAPASKPLSVSYPLKAKKGTHIDTLYCTIHNPKLWYINGLGKPNLYVVGASLKVKEKTEDYKTLSLGLRTLELVLEKDLFGETFFFRLNGLPVFMKGANYIPQHSFVSEIKKKDHAVLVALAKDANMNMLRVWGGGLYEDDSFYEACDRNGILVWQDLMFACAMYPADSVFLANVKEEVRQQALRLRQHPCLALWCGNNEIDEGWHNWGWQKQYRYSVTDSAHIWSQYQQLFHDVIPNTLQLADPQTAYWPSSPSIGWGHRESLVRGDSHYWGVWWGMEPFDVYETKVGRFMSEYGFQGMPSLRVFNSFCDTAQGRLGSDAVKAHQKHPTGYETIQRYMERDYQVPENFEHYIYVSQLLQRDAMRTAIEAHRRAKPYCMGTLYWQFNDCWPVTSWSALDNTRGKKALYYETKKLYNDLLISVGKRKSKYEIFVVSDKPQAKTASLVVMLRNTRGDTLLHRQHPIRIEANSSAVYASIGEEELEAFPPDEVYLSCTLTDSAGTLLASKRHFFVKPKDLRLQKPEIDIRFSVAEQALIITSRQLVKDLFLAEDGLPGGLSDNFIDIEPGTPVKVHVKGLLPGQPIPKHFSLYDCGIYK